MARNLPVKSLIQSKDSLLSGSEMDWQKNLAKIMDILLNGLGGAMGAAASILSSVVSTMVTALVAVIFSIYLLAGKEKIAGQFKRLFTRYLPHKATDKIYYVTKTLDHSFHSFIVGQCTEAVVLGLLCMLGMFLLRRNDWLPDWVYGSDSGSGRLYRRSHWGVYDFYRFPGAGCYFSDLPVGLTAAGRQPDLPAYRRLFHRAAGYLGACCRNSRRRRYGHSGHVPQCAPCGDCLPAFKTRRLQETLKRGLPK